MFTSITEALNAYQTEAAAICAASTSNPGLRATCCFSTECGQVSIMVEVRDITGQLQFTGLGANPLADMARMLGVAYPLPVKQYATCAQVERIKQLVKHSCFSPAERTKVLLGINQLTDFEATGVLLTLQSDIDHRAQPVAA